MRSSGCTIQHALTPEATDMVKQAVSLARQRGHGQVTPLHVATAMLSSSSSAGLLRQACLQSHTHPLQCRALELCFNVALNRLPASASSSPMLPVPLLHHHHPHPHPSISNALVAAFKRAQAHQRRGSIEHHHQQVQQQPILAVKIEVEQLIISILDDPSVSRVMREAGFSSTSVKAKVEDTISSKDDHDHLGYIKESCSSKDGSDHVKIEDVSSVIEGLLASGKRKRCCVVVGECLATLESAIKGAMDTIKRGEDHSIGDSLRDVRFEGLSLDSFGALSRDEIELKLAQITRLAKCYASKGLVLYLGDLRWAIEFRKGGGGEQRRSCSYCPVEHVMMELGRLVAECSSELGRLWLVGAATFHTYTRFGSGNPSLEAIWGFHAITIPARSLGLSLTPQSDSLASKTTNGTMSWLLIKDGRQDHIHDSKLEEDNNYNKNKSCNSEPTTPNLPSWLQKYKDENNKQDSTPVKDLCKSWSFSETTLSFSSVSPPSFSEFSYDRPPCFNPQQTWSMHVPSSASSSDVMEKMECTEKRFKLDYNSWSLGTLCNALESKVPWQKEIIPNVASTVLDCRSRNLRIKRDDDNKNDHSKEETWFLFLGDDVNGKEKIARELARLVFGSENKYISIGLSSFSSTEDSRNKRLRDDQSFTFTDRLMEAVSVDPHRVFFVEDIEQMDYVSQVGINRAIERGKITSSCDGKEVSLEDAIIILSCERFSSRSRACSPSTKHILYQHHHHHHHHHHHQGGPREEENVGCCSDESKRNSTSPTSVSLDLNISISDGCSFDDQDHKDQTYVDEVGLVGYVDKCILFKL